MAKTEVYVGRPVVVDGVQYGKGYYMVDPKIARKLDDKKSELTTAQFMRGERADIEAEAEAERRLFEGAEDDERSLRESTDSLARIRGEQSAAATGSPRLNALEAGLGEQDQSATGSPASTGQSSAPADSRTSEEKIKSLSGPIPADFPAKAQLESGGVTSLEQLAGMKGADLDAIPGIGERKVEEIGAALYRLAESTPANS